MLERDRHNELLAKLRKMGVRIILIADGDIGRLNRHMST